MDAGENDLAKFLIDRQSRPKEISSLFEGNKRLDESLSPDEHPAPRKKLEVLREVLRGTCIEARGVTAVGSPTRLRFLTDN